MSRVFERYSLMTDKANGLSHVWLQIIYSHGMDSYIWEDLDWRPWACSSILILATAHASRTTQLYDIGTWWEDELLIAFIIRHSPSICWGIEPRRRKQSPRTHPTELMWLNLIDNALLAMHLRIFDRHFVLVREWQESGCWKKGLDWLPASSEIGAPRAGNRKHLPIWAIPRTDYTTLRDVFPLTGPGQIDTHGGRVGSHDLMLMITRYNYTISYLLPMMYVYGL